MHTHTGPYLPQLPTHPLPPPGPIMSHRPDNNTTPRRHEPHKSEQPAIANNLDERLRDNGPNGTERVPDEIVGRHARGRLAGHEFREHGRHRGENDHGSDAEEEIRDQGCEPEGAALSRPAVPDQRAGVQDRCYPGVFAHAVFGPVDQLAGLRVEAACAASFAGHDVVGPAAAEEGGEDVAEGVGDVEDADYESAVIVGGAGEGHFDGNVEEVEGAEGDGSVVDCEEDGGIAEVEDCEERLDEEAS